MRRATNLRTQLILWVVMLEALLLLIFSGALVLVLQNLQKRQTNETLRTSAAQLNAAIEVQAGQYRIEQGDADALQIRGILAWVLRPDDSLAQTLGSASMVAQPNSLPDFDHFLNTTLANGDLVRLLKIPLQANGQRLGTVIVALSLRDSERLQQQTLLSLSIAIPLVLLLSAAGGLFLAGRALAPVSAITTTVQRISAADLSQRIALTLPNDEIGRLARTFNTMLERLDHAFQRERQLTADVSHELRTPLALLKTQLSLARVRPRDAKTLLTMMRDMEADVDRMTDLVEQLLTLTRIEQTDRLDVAVVDLTALFESLVEQFMSTAQECGITLQLDLPFRSSLEIAGHRERLRQVFSNLLENAIKYTAAGGQVRVVCLHTERHVIVQISDTGIGIAPEHLPHLFERFYRADNARTRTANDFGDGFGGGFGLGLAITAAIVQAHDGQIKVQSTIGQGTTFIVTLPIRLTSA